MDGLTIGLIGFGVMLVLLVVRVPIGVAMLAVGVVGYVSIAGEVALFSYLKTETYWRFTAETLSVVPLFILMGQFAASARLRGRLWRRRRRWDRSPCPN